MIRLILDSEILVGIEKVILASLCFFSVTLNANWISNIVLGLALIFQLWFVIQYRLTLVDTAILCSMAACGVPLFWPMDSEWFSFIRPVNIKPSPLPTQQQGVLPTYVAPYGQPMPVMAVPPNTQPPVYPVAVPVGYYTGPSTQ